MPRQLQAGCRNGALRTLPIQIGGDQAIRIVVVFPGALAGILCDGTCASLDQPRCRMQPRSFLGVVGGGYCACVCSEHGMLIEQRAWPSGGSREAAEYLLPFARSVTGAALPCCRMPKCCPAKADESLIDLTWDRNRIHDRSWGIVDRSERGGTGLSGKVWS